MVLEKIIIGSGSIHAIFLEQWCLTFSFSIFFIGISGIVFSRKNLIGIMISIELMLLGACLNFIFFSVFLDSMIGQMFALIVIAIAAADSAIGLGILIAAFYLKRNILFESFSFLKG
jgi:NADH-quinone oxidoreductase subunit K